MYKTVLILGSLVFLTFSVVSTSAGAKENRLGKSVAQNIASLDWTTIKCSDRMDINGEYYILLQAIWRGVLVQSEGNLQNDYEKEFAAIESDMKLAVDQGKDSCLIMFLWFRAMMPNTSPITQMR